MTQQQPGTSAAGISSALLIQELALSAPAATFDFANIPQTYRHLELIITGQSSGFIGNVNMNVFMQFNGDTGANYHWQLEFATAATVAASDAVNQTSGLLGYIAATNAGDVAGASGILYVRIPNYSKTVFHKLYDCSGHVDTGDVSGNRRHFFGSGRWKNAAAINEVVVAQSAGNFVVGSVASLYGIP